MDISIFFKYSIVITVLFELTHFQNPEIVIALSKNAATYSEQDFYEAQSTDNYAQPDSVLTKEANSQSVEIQEANELYLRENKRILIAEDNEDLRKLIARFLSSYYDVMEASNGMAASILIRDMEIDLTISDIMMPEKNGITLCCEVKNDINSSHIPFIMLTAKLGQESELEGLGSGEIAANKQCNVFLKKLYDLIELNIDRPELDVNYVASELSMSKSKLYAKLKSITGKSLVEIMLNYRLKKAMHLIT